VEPVPDFARLLQSHLRRTEWGDFPDVVIHTEESLVKKHPLYAAAKSGDALAAEKLAIETTTIGAIDRISAIVGSKSPKRFR